VLGNFLDKLVKVEGLVAALAFLSAATAILADVVGRELLGHGVWGAAKFAVFCAVIAGFLGIGVATHAGMHLRPRFADGWVPERFETLVQRISSLISSALFIALGVAAIMYVRDSYSFGQVAPVLDWPMWMVQIVMPYAFFSNATRHMIYAVQPELLPQSKELFG